MPCPFASSIWIEAEAARAAIDRALEATAGDEAIRIEAGEAMNRLQRDEGFITAWLFSGPYMKEQAGGGELFDVPFAPELPDGDAQWRPVPASAISSPGICNLLAVDRGDNRCAYLKAELIAERSGAARLELGSDDGLKVFLNGEVVHANNAMRGLSRGSDVCTVTLKQGVNILMLKITQGGGDWKACCRIRAADGFALRGVRLVTP